MGAVAAGLLLLLPAFAYTGTIMTESAFLPLFLIALSSFARALETPTVVWQLAAVAAALAARDPPAGTVLLAVLVTAIVLDAVAAGRGRGSALRSFGARLRRFARDRLALLAGALAFLVYALVSAGGRLWGLGGYSEVFELEYSLSAGLRWTVFHAGELAFAVGLIPVFGLLCSSPPWMRPWRDPAERAFVCVTAAALLWIVPQAGFFASRYSGRIEERNMFYLEPLLFLALVAWVARGAPRPARWTAVAVAVPLALLPRSRSSVCSTSRCSPTRSG